MAATELVRRGGTENRWLPLECGTARKIGGWEADRPPKPWTCLQRAQQAPFCRVIFASLAVFKETSHSAHVLPCLRTGAGSPGAGTLRSLIRRQQGPAAAASAGVGSLPCWAGWRDFLCAWWAGLCSSFMRQSCSPPPASRSRGSGSRWGRGEHWLWHRTWRAHSACWDDLLNVSGHQLPPC